MRDFLSADSPGGHADFASVTGPFQGNWNAPAINMVQPELGADGVPVYNGNDEPGGSFVVGEGKRLTSKENFDMWYRDTLGFNMQVDRDADGAPCCSQVGGPCCRCHRMSASSLPSDDRVITAMR
jgi:hypothetical protein